MRRRPSEPAMMVWQAEKCVMLGAYQVAYAEVDMDYARQAGIQIVRRSSGGGAIFTDMGTFLYTMIQPYRSEAPVRDIARETIAGAVVGALNEMGVPAVLEGRNDILVDGKKISGIAQQVRHGCLCTHGSLLYDTDLEMLADVLRVDDEKIRSKAIRSVRGRVTNIKEYVGLSTRDFGDRLKRNLMAGTGATEYVLTDDELNEIENIYREKYGNAAWTFGNSPAFSFHNSRRFPGGKVEVYLDIVGGTVASCAVRGDFLGTAAIRELEEKLENTVFEYDALRGVLEGLMLHPYLGSVTKDELLACIFERKAEEK